LDKRDEASDGVQEFCGFCGAQMPAGASQCPACGKSQPFSFCGFCGARIPIEASVCTECGQIQPEVPSEPTPPRAPTTTPQVLAEQPRSPPQVPLPPVEKPETAIKPQAAETKPEERPASPPMPQPQRPVATSAEPPIQVSMPAPRAYAEQPGPIPRTDEMLIVRNLSVTRGKKTLVQGIDFAVNRGEIVGLLGPSGAGKTTIIKVLTTEYPCPPGQVVIGGYDLATQAQSAKQMFGYVPQDYQLYEDLTFAQNVMFFGGQYGLDQMYLFEKAQQLAAAVDLGERLNDKVRRLSGGQKKRVSVATALAHDPQLVILDEPTSGLDPASRRGLWRFLKSISQSYMVTMIVTTHFLDEAEYCDKILIINKGRMVTYDTPRNLKQRMPGEGKAIELEMFTIDDYVSAMLARFETSAKQSGVAEMIDRSGYKIRIFCKDISKSIAKIPTLLTECGLGFKSMNVVDTSLEDTFIYLTGERFREEE